MTTPPLPPPATRAWLRDLAFGLVGIVGVVLGVVVTDLVVDGSPPLVPESASIFPVARAGGSDAGAPGAVLVPIDASVSGEDSVGFLPGLLAEEPGAGVGTGTSGPASEGRPGDSDPPTVAGGLVSFPLPDLDPVGWYARFLDACALEGAVGCPFGIGGTIAFDVFAGEVPPLVIEVYPDANPALFPDLRCDPGLPSGSSIPLVILSNRPLSTLDIYLDTEGGAVLDDHIRQGTGFLDSHINQRSSPREIEMFEARLGAGTQPAADVERGVHHCFLLDFDRSEEMARIGTFTVRVSGDSPRVPAGSGFDVAEREVVFLGAYDAARMPVVLFPEDQNRALLIVPETDQSRTPVWIYESGELGHNGCEGDKPLDNDPYRRVWNLDMGSGWAVAIDPDVLNRSDWQWDRDTTRLARWELNLKHSTVYTLCVGSVQHEVITPDGFDLEIVGGNLRHTRSVDQGELRVLVTGIHSCWVADPQPYQGTSDSPFPVEDLVGDGIYKRAHSSRMCHSLGYAVGDEITLEARYSSDTYQVGAATYQRRHDVEGVVQMPTALLLDRCTTTAGERPGNPPPCRTVLEWRNQDTACGGGLSSPNCLPPLFFSLEVDFYVRLDTSTNRPNPTDWGFSEVAPIL